MRRLWFLGLTLVAAACATTPTLPDPGSFPARSARRFDPRKCDPAAVERPDPDYPPEARVSKIEGWVLFSVLIDPTGRVRDPIVLAATPEGVFDQATLSAVSRWRFCPPERGNEPPELRSLYQFRLAD